jgi:hypothetical protein
MTRELIGGKPPRCYAPGLAYWDTFTGLIPCRVTRVHDDGTVTVVLTAARRPYQRGETHTVRAWHVAPRDRIRRRRYSTIILAGYVWCAL